MAVCKPNLENVSMLTPLGFRLTINANEFRYLEYFCIAANLPTVSLQAFDTPFRGIREKVQGDSLSHENLTVTFIVDEELKNYNELYKWMYNNARVDSESYRNVFRDMTLSILSNQNTTNKQVQFYSAIPVSLSALEFNVQTTDVEYLSCQVEFAYTSFSFG